MIRHSSSPRKWGPITTAVYCQEGNWPRVRTRGHGVWVPAFRGDDAVYFFAGAVLVSAGFAASGFAASGLVSVFAVSSGLSMRSTLAASRSLVT